ncbi:MAG: FemAB family XrtA/PEP-CTERM system-associated protein [Candidatus Entotheonellia bacterium]
MIISAARGGWVEIQLNHDVTSKAWDHYVQSAPRATFFHLTGWRRVVEKSFGHRAFYLHAEEGGIIRGVLPLFYLRSLLFGRSLVSVPFGVYGGIVADNREVEASLLGAAQGLAQQLRVQYLELRHLHKTDLHLPTKALYVTFQRGIDRDLDKNMAAIPRKQRRMIRQGMSHGLTSRIGDEPLNEFYEIYAHSCRNLGTPVFSRRFFQNLQRELGEACKILSVWHEGKMVAGVMTFFFKDWVMPYYGGGLREYFAYAINDFMYWELMRYGCEHGYRVFDFGRSKQGTGAFDFKRHWGFEPQPLCYQYYLYKSRDMPNLSPANPKFRIFIDLWKHIPLPITKYLGPMIVRSIP